MVTLKDFIHSPAQYQWKFTRAIFYATRYSLSVFFQLFYYSAHYPTMFSLFTALGLNKDPASPLRRIPYYASLVFIELRRDADDGKFSVQFSFRNGLEVSFFFFFAFITLCHAEHCATQQSRKVLRYTTVIWGLGEFLCQRIPLLTERCF